MDIGHRHWVIAEGYIPPPGPNADDSTLASHETACILNAGSQPARIELTLFFKDRDPVGPYRIEVPARRTLHLRFDELKDPAPLPRETDYASLFVSDVPVVIQHTRLDARPQALALVSTLAHGSD